MIDLGRLVRLAVFKIWLLCKRFLTFNAAVLGRFGVLITSLLFQDHRFVALVHEYTCSAGL